MPYTCSEVYVPKVSAGSVIDKPNKEQYIKKIPKAKNRNEKNIVAFFGGLYDMNRHLI